MTASLLCNLWFLPPDREFLIWYLNISPPWQRVSFAITESYLSLTESFLSDLSVIPLPDTEFPIRALSHFSPCQRVSYLISQCFPSLTESFLSHLSVFPLPDREFPIWSLSLSSVSDSSFKKPTGLVCTVWGSGPVSCSSDISFSAKEGPVGGLAMRQTS